MVTELGTNSTGASQPKKRLRRPYRVFRECFAAVGWICLFIDAIVYDLGSLVSTTGWPWESPWLPWYTFLLVACILVVSLRILGAKSVLTFLLFVCFYPFVWLCWRLPRVVIRHPEAALAFVPFGIHWFKHFRLRVVSILLGLCGATFVLSGASTPWQVAGVVCLCIYLIIHYGVQVNKTIRVAQYLPKLGMTITQSWDKSVTGTARKAYDAMNALEPNTEAFQRKRIENIRSLLWQNAGHLWLANKVQKAFDRHWLDIALIGSVCFTLVITVLVFTLCFHGLGATSAGSLSDPSSLWLHFYLSVNAVFHNSVDAIRPTSQVAQAFLIIEQACSYLLSMVFVYLVFTVLREGYRAGVTQLIDRLRQDRKVYEQQLLELYNLSIPDALVQLERSPAFGEKINDFIRNHLADQSNVTFTDGP